jgi:plasmid rolling circle replication initiator protein Rep
MSILPVYRSNIKSEESKVLEIDSKNSTDEKPAYLAWYEEEILTPQSPDEPEPSESENFNVYEYLYQNEPPEGVEIALSDVSDKDSLWDSQRAKTATVGDIYSYNAEFERYYERMSDCSTWLSFGFNENGMKLKNANFCRIRHCPVCQWRKSLFWKHNMYVAYDEIKEKYPTHRWVFLTLTVKNCEIGDLRETLQNMNKAWDRLAKRKVFKSVVDGWIRTTEVTRPKDGTHNTHAHPHFHVMLLVKPSYFAKNYIKQDEWTELWRDVLRVDYQPVVDIRAIKNKSRKKDFDPDVAVKNAIAETLKYAVKPSDLVGDGSKKANEWFFELTRQTFKLRFISSGGALKNAFKSEDSMTDDDLIKTSDDEDDIGETDERRIVFTYRKIRQQYIYAPQYNQ